MKHKLLTFILTMGLFASCATNEMYVYTSFHEPATDGLRYLASRDGVHWDSVPGTWLKPEVGKQRVMRDPSIVRTPNGVYHFVWTCSWRGDPGFGYAESKDLIHWSEQRFIKVMDDPTTVNVWAPELFYDDVRKQCMIVWASCIPHKFPRGVEDEDNNHRLYYTTTKDFKTFAPARLLIDTDFSAIDATILKRAKNDYVMVLKDNTRPNRNLKVSFATDPQGPWSTPSAQFTENFVEGPTVAKVDGSYIIYYDRYKKYDFGAMQTTDFRTFREVTDSVSIPKLHKHGTIFKAPARLVRKLFKHKGAL